MYRIFRPMAVLACACLLTSPAVHAADYLLNDQVRVATTGTGTSGLSADDFDAAGAAVAIAPVEQVALVVWFADDASVSAETGYVVDEEFEIYGRLVASDVFEARSDKFRISTMGDDTETGVEDRQRYGAANPAVTWNPVSQEFLVVWEGDDDAGSLVDGEIEIFGQRINTSGELVGERLRISVMGDDSATDSSERQRYGASNPAVAADPATGQYLVTWQGDTGLAPLVDDEIEVYGRILASDATPAGSRFRISTAGNESDTGAERVKYAAVRPAVVYNPEGYFVVAWQADGNENGLVNGENEIFVAKVDDSGLLEPPARISTMGPDGDAGFDALSPALAVDPATGTMLVTWHGDTSTGVLVENEFEVHGRVLSFDALASGESFRISRMGSDDQSNAEERARFEGSDSAVEWSPYDQKFLVAWNGDTDESPLVDDEFEIHGRYVSADGALVGESFRISVNGDDEEEETDNRLSFMAEQPAIAFGSSALFIAWHGDSETDGKTEIWAARAAENFTTLSLDYASSLVKPVVPEPIVIEYVLTNIMDETARNVTVHLSMSEEFPLTWSGCDRLTDEGVCELGDIAAESEARFSVSLATDQIELGDPQGTTLTVIVNSDSALKDPLRAVRKTFAGATLMVDGGAGIAGWLLMLLAGVAVLVRGARRHD